MKTYNRSGEQMMDLGLSSLLSITTGGFKFGSDGELYKLNNGPGGNNKWYKVIINNIDGYASLDLDVDNPLESVA